MVTEIRVYFEGDKALRPAFNSFLKPVIDSFRQRRIRFQLIAGGSTDETIQDFMDGVQDYPAAFNILLVDSDGPDGGNLIASIKGRSTWNGRVGARIQDNQIHFMVEVMESWLLADKDALANYYGNGFQTNRLPQNPSIEEIFKADVISGLESATSSTPKGKYHKTRHAPDLLQQVDVSKVRNAAPNCDRLFVALNHLTTST